MKVLLTCWSLEGHLSQIYTGLALLHGQGAIRLEQRIVPAPPMESDPACPPHLRQVRNWHCSVRTDHGEVYFDVHDDDAVSTDALGRHDAYMKRSFSARWNDHPLVRPLGLNYLVYRDGLDPWELQRRARLRGLLPALRHALKPQPGVSQIEAAPGAPTEPRVVFLCRTWEPEPDRTEEKNRERLEINAMRAECIAVLRRAFGTRCIAGFSRSAYALRFHPEHVVTDQRVTERRAFLQLVRSSSVCVATKGLHNSNGWKLGEYIANSRCVVSETLHHAVPGFQAGAHYLEFTTPQSCLEAVGTLMESSERRREMAEANWSYYQEYLRPDRLVGRALGL